MTTGNGETRSASTGEALSDQHLLAFEYENRHCYLRNLIITAHFLGLICLLGVLAPFIVQQGPKAAGCMHVSYKVSAVAYLLGTIYEVNGRQIKLSSDGKREPTEKEKSPYIAKAEQRKEGYNRRMEASDMKIEGGGDEEESGKSSLTK
nr:HMG1/2-like protein [Ipomoea batatas]